MAATEAWQSNPTPELKEAAVKAVAAAKTAQAEASKAQAANQPPEKYAFTMPKDTTLKPENVQALEAFAKANKMTQTQAQAFLERESQAQAERDKAFDMVKETWLKTTMADKEIGGDNLKASAELAKRVLDRFDQGGELRKDLDSTGLGNHPGLLKFLVKMGKSMSEDQLVGGTGQTTDQPKSAAAVLFPKSLAAATGAA